MRGRSIGWPVVTDGPRRVGIVTVPDFLTAIARGGDRPVTSAQRCALIHRVPCRVGSNPAIGRDVFGRTGIRTHQ